MARVERFSNRTPTASSNVFTCRLTVDLGTRITLAAALKAWDPKTPYLIKPNCGGSGNDITLSSAKSVRSSDHLVLLQSYVESPTDTLVRMEFVDRELVYALQVRTSREDFNNCPSDHCTVEHCPIGGSKFSRLEGFPRPPAERDMVRGLQRLIAANRLDIAGVEAVLDKDGKWWIIDINCVNTNYNRKIESRCAPGRGGTARVADLLVRRAAAHRPPAETDPPAV